jgi:hypothetical protein
MNRLVFAPAGRDVSAFPMISLSLLSLSVILFALSGCGSSSDISGMDASQMRPEWSIQLKASCADTPAENCVAGYPYSVGADGLYRVGPGPQGQLLSGKLSADEFATLQRLYFDSVASARAHSGDAVCVQVANSSEETSDTVSYVPRTGDQKEWVHMSENNTCSHLSSPEAAQKLLTFMRDSAANHYPLPFPDDACDEARASLESVYGKVRECKTDVDCSYFDESFQPVATDLLTFLVTGDCSGAQPLVVGNRSTVAAKRPLLLQTLSHAQEACKKRAASSCAGFSDFQPTRPAPICGGGICRARSG